MGHRFVLAALLSAGALLLGCMGKDPYNPGDSLGTFHVEARRLTATCGASQSPPDPWKFDVRLSQEANSRKVYWIQGGAPVSGTLDANNRTAMTSSDTRTLREPSKTRAACIVRRDDKLEASFDATSTGTGAAAATAKLEVKGFSGTLRYLFTPEDGSDCSDVIVPSPAAGQVAGAASGESAESAGFEALPCEVAFELSGARKPDR